MTVGVYAQRFTDKLDRGLVAMKVGNGVYLSWRVLGEEYYDVTYNVYRDGVKVNTTPLSVSNYTDKSGTVNSSYTIAPVVRGQEQAQSKQVKPWTTTYKEIQLAHEGIKSTLIPNDACCADVDGDGELEILMKFDNDSEASQSYPKNGPKIGGVDTKEYSIMECLKMDGTRLWWINCGPNMGDFQNNEQNIVAYDWDQDGKAEVVMRACDGTVIHKADGTTYTVGDASVNVRAATGGGTNWFVITTGEYLLYMNGETGEPYQCLPYPLKLLENGESDVNKAWGDGYGHRASKHFFGAPCFDGRKASIFLARGIYTRHKMIAYDVDPATHKLTERWRWFNNSDGPWKEQGYHNYCVADVDLDGRDEIVFGSMVIDDNGKGLSTTGFGHGDAEHVGNLNPYHHGLEIYACMEYHPGNNYRDATTSKIYHRYEASKDDGRCMAGNFTNSFPGGLGKSSREGAISTITAKAVSGLDATGVDDNFRIYWDGDLCEETFNGTGQVINDIYYPAEGCVHKYGSWTPIYTFPGSVTNNYTKATPCYQGDLFGDWREEVILRTANNHIRIYSTTAPTEWRIPTLWHDHQYRNAMVWQMCGYNQPPRPSFFLGELEGITIAPPPLTMTDRVEVSNNGTIGSGLNGKHAIVYETGNSSVAIEAGAQPEILTFNVPTWVQGTALSETTNATPKINYTTYTCTVTGSGISGNGRLVKQGDGILTLPKADFTHTGETNIWDGTLNFDGKMKQSPLWLNRHTELNSDGGEFKSIKADYGSVIRPGGADKRGTITTETLLLGFGSRLAVDLYSEGTLADVVKANVLKIERKTGTAWTQAGPEYLMPVIELTGHMADGEQQLAAGKYVIAEVGEIEGQVTDILLEGLNTQKKNLIVEDGKLIVEIVGMRDAAIVTWSGANSNKWDVGDSFNFVIGDEQESTAFVSGDEVVFDDQAVTRSVNILSDVYPAKVLVSNSGSGYTFKGNGAISGTAQFVKENSGTVTMDGENSYTGGNHLLGGTTKVKKLSNQYSATGNLGAITTKPDLFTIENGAILQTTAEVEQASPMKMVGSEGGIINNSANFKMNASLTGTKLTKKGDGCLYLMKANTLESVVMTAGSIAIQNNSALKSIELQSGTLWDDVQATTHAIIVPKGKSATWQLSGTSYTAYSNKLTGAGVLTIIPRNTVQRVRILGDWSQFEGTIKHTTSNIVLPLDMSGGMPKGTLDIASGCTVTNVCKTFKIGKVTGSGSLGYPIANFYGQGAVNGNNTWDVGNSWEENGDFTFAGTFTDAGGSNKCIFNKVGTCKMTVSGKSNHTGATTVKEGELCLRSGAQIGKGALAVSKGAVLSGITSSSAPLLNSLFTINGTLRPGSLTTSTLGTIHFNNKNVTISNTGVLVIRAASKSTHTSLAGIAKLTINGTIRVEVDDDTHSLKPGDEIQLWPSTTELTGTPTFDLPANITWDTSRISEGVLVVTDVNTSILSALNDTDARNVYDLRGRLVRRQMTATSTEGLPAGIYIRGGRKIIVR